MNNKQQPEPAGPLNLGFIYFVIFRHKWKIIVFALAGIVAAAVYYRQNQPVYQSEAKLLIRYITDTRPLTAPGDDTTKTSDAGGNALSAELQILTSFDLAHQVAIEVGAGRILGKFGGDTNLVGTAAEYQAAKFVRDHLGIYVPPYSSVINLDFTCPDAQLAQDVLKAVISNYLTTHNQIHQPQFTDDGTVKADLRNSLNDAETKLVAAKTNAGIISLDDTKRYLSDQIAKVEEQLFEINVELKTRQEMLNRIGGDSPTNQPMTNEVAAPEIPPAPIEQYNKINALLARLQQRSDSFLGQGYTEDNVLVKDLSVQIAKNKELKTKLEQKYPGLASMGTTATATAGSPAASNEAGVPTALLESQTNVLNQALNKLRARSIELAMAEPNILDLQRQVEIQDQYMQYFTKSLSDEEINQTLKTESATNIVSIESPTPAVGLITSRMKMVKTLLGGGIGIGLALAFLIELFWDRSFKRPTEIETKLKLPLFLSIPNMHLNGSRSRFEKRHLSVSDADGTEPEVVNGKTNGKTGHLEIAPWSASNAMRSFYEALRDRIVVHFEVRNLVHNPKLVAVTSANRGAGVTTIAMGLAASLSETGEGNVLLVDMNVEQGAVQQFYKGKPGCPLDHAFEAERRGEALVQNNLYVVSDSSRDDKLPRIMPKRFSNLLPKFKASDYDYIIFDMPPVTQTSVTPRLAGHMDMVLLVVEAEKTDRDIVRRANALLGESKANVIAVLNKTRKYVPDKLHQEYLSDS